jgi:hypothetical protein
MNNKKNDPSFVNKKREFKKTGRMNEINEDEMEQGLREIEPGPEKTERKPLVDASSDSIIDAPYLEVYEGDFNFYKRERKLEE